MGPIKPGWDEFVNNSGSTIPARGIVRCKGMAILEAGRVQLSVDQPNSYGDVGNCFVIGPVQVKNGKYGSCTRTALSGVVEALYDETSGTPAYGTTWGPVSGSFKMSAKGQGWFCLGAPTNTTLKIALFSPMPMAIVRGKIASSVAAGATGTLTVWTGDFGSEATTGLTISNVFNPGSCAVTTTGIATAHYVPDNQRWQFIVGTTA